MYLDGNGMLGYVVFYIYVVEKVEVCYMFLKVGFELLIVVYL